MKIHPKIGDTNGKLTVVDLVHRNGGIRVVCLCSCGRTRSFQANELFGKAPRFAACNVNGCRQITVTHGLSRIHRIEYVVWKTMRSRCNNPKNHKFPLYGARGIKICHRWDSFALFFADMGLRPSERHSIERMDNSGNYEPGNCRWALPVDQARNTRANRFLTANGETMIVAQWADRLCVTQDFLHGRLSRGWSHERIINEPKHYRG